MRLRISILAILLASSLLVFAHKEETLAELITRAGSSKLEDRPHLYTEIARRQVKAADQLYSAGKPEEARTAVRDVVEYSDKASDAATNHNHVNGQHRNHEDWNHEDLNHEDHKEHKDHKDRKSLRTSHS